MKNASKYRRKLGVAVEPLEPRCLLSVSQPLDPTFGQDGTGIVTFKEGSLNEEVVLPNGNTVGTGFYDYQQSGYFQPTKTFYEAWVAELNSSGQDVGSVFSPASTTPMEFNSLVVLRSGNILALGNGLAQLYNPTVPISAVGAEVQFSATPLTAQPDGKILVDVAQGIERLNPDGTVDPTFNHGKPLAIDFDPVVTAIQPDGTLFIAGKNTSTGAAWDVEVLKLHADGSPDRSFGKAGSDRVALGFLSASYNIPETLAIEPDGRIVFSSQTASGAQIAAFTPNGHLDHSFGTAGLIELPSDYVPTLVVSGGRVTAVYGTESGQVEISRFLSDGQLDTSFNAGSALPVPGVQSGTGSVFAAPTLDGKIIIGGVQVARIILPVVPAFGRLHLPPVAVAGARLNARLPIILTNEGDAVKNADIVINIYADTGTNLDGNQVLLASVKKKVSLNADQRLAIQMQIKSLPQSLAGTYHLLVETVDPSGATSATASTQTIHVAAPAAK